MLDTMAGEIKKRDRALAAMLQPLTQTHDGGRKINLRGVLEKFNIESERLQSLADHLGVRRGVVQAIGAIGAVSDNERDALCRRRAGSLRTIGLEEAAGHSQRSSPDATGPVTIGKRSPQGQATRSRKGGNAKRSPTCRRHAVRIGNDIQLAPMLHNGGNRRFAAYNVTNG